MNIVITGSNSGFGRLTATTLAQAGHTVFATMRSAATKNAQAAEALKATSPNIRVVEVDVTDDGSVSRGVDAIAQQTDGAIDVLVNNAGRFSMGVQEAFDIDALRSLFETNVFGTARMNRAVLPFMRKQRSGLIVALSSILGRISLPTAGTYAATKFAVEALGDALRDEVQGLGIDVVLVEPGAFPTNVGSNGLYADASHLAADYGPVAELPQKMGDGLAQLFGGPMAPDPQDVADAIATLVSTPAGKRPARVVVDKLSGDPIRAVNETYARQYRALCEAFGIA
ncbi:MAG: SDR family NAD(P)-dependent oxidoreductase [Betaproteobacteria bacterium]|nr:SDR family NAD(P)-dependent oxidoreductase [Betaproteobacteria bacterium]